MGAGKSTLTFKKNWLYTIYKKPDTPVRVRYIRYVDGVIKYHVFQLKDGDLTDSENKIVRRHNKLQQEAIEAEAKAIEAKEKVTGAKKKVIEAKENKRESGRIKFLENQLTEAKNIAIKTQIEATKMRKGAELTKEEENILFPKVDRSGFIPGENINTDDATDANEFLNIYEGEIIEELTLPSWTINQRGENGQITEGDSKSFKPKIALKF